MQISQMAEGARKRRDQTREAIKLATQGRWAKAAQVNREILAFHPNDVESRNRLAKALSELGSYSEARQEFQEALNRDPGNAIARRNLERIANLKDAPTPRSTERVAPLLFIAERGKSATTILHSPAASQILAEATAGDTLDLQVDGATVYVNIHDGPALGHLEPKLAARLIKLLDGGNRYVVAVASVSPEEVSAVLREVYQHPKMAGIVSFPARSEEMVPYFPMGDDGTDDTLEPGPARDWPTGEEQEKLPESERSTRPPKGALAEDDTGEDEP